MIKKPPSMSELIALHQPLPLLTDHRVSENSQG